MRAIELWAFSGTISRKNFFFIGVIAFLLKSNLDRLLASYFFDRSWGLLNYWFSFHSVKQPWLLNGADLKLSASLLTLSLPFIWMGIAQTVRRLRDCKQPLCLSALFFVPFVNLIFFAVLCRWPSATHSTTTNQVRERQSEQARFVSGITQSETLWAAALAIGATTLIGIAGVVLGTQFQGNYGLGLFVAMPFCLGLFSVLIYSYRTPRTQRECVMISIVPLVLLGAGLLLLAFEGVVCILMAAPLGLGLSAMGGVVGYWIQEARWRSKGAIRRIGSCVDGDTALDGAGSEDPRRTAFAGGEQLDRS
jgi:uncharacterized membrane protein YhaH (DUF805 family)